MPVSHRIAPKTNPNKVIAWIAEHELWLVMVAMPLLLLPNRAAPLGFALILFIWLCRRMTRGYLTVRTPLDLPILGLLMMLPVSLYVSADLSLSRVSLYQIVAGVALFYGLANSLHSEVHVWRMIGLLIAGGVALALIAPLTTEWETSKLFSLPQVYKRFPLLLKDPINSNVLAGALVMIIPIAMTLFLSSDHSYPRPFLVFALFVMLAIVFLTQSRGAFIALVIGILILGILRSRWVLFSIPLILIGLFIAMQRLGLMRFSDLLLTTDALGGWEGRREVWSRAIYMIKDFPYTGIGLGTFLRVGPVMYPYFIFGRPDAHIPHAHNLFLQVAVDLGLPGLVAYLYLFGYGLTMGWKTYRAFGIRGEVRLQALALGLLTSLLVMGVHGLTDAVTWGTKSAIIPWFVMGLIATLHKNNEPQPCQKTARMPRSKLWGLLAKLNDDSVTSI